MNCPECGAGFNDLYILESRPRDNYVRRRRRCDKCEHRFTTIEMVPVNGKIKGGSDGNFAARFSLVPTMELTRLRATVDNAFKHLLSVADSLDEAAAVTERSQP